MSAQRLVRLKAEMTMMSKNPAPGAYLQLYSCKGKFLRVVLNFYGIWPFCFTP